MVLIRTPSDIDPAEITPESVYRERRRFMQAGLTLAGAAALGTQPRETRAGVYGNVARSPFGTDETLTELKDVTGYNNFYEFGTGKEDPAANARTLKTAPWSVAVEGECARPGTYTQSLHKSWQ